VACLHVLTERLVDERAPGGVGDLADAPGEPGQRIVEQAKRGPLARAPPGSYVGQ
jgi:hypothetical protein